MRLTQRIHAAGILLAVSSVATAQDSTFGRQVARRSSFTVSAIQSRPQGALARNVGLGYGIGGAYLYRLDDKGVWSIRADVGALAYGNESKQSAFSETVGGRVQTNVRTTNYIVPMSVGPQLTWPRGVIRPYVNAGLGGEAFFTESAVDGLSETTTTIASTTNQSAFASSWVVGSGVYLPLAYGKMKLSLDIGLQYLGGSRTKYLVPGSLVDLPAGGLQITPMESKTHLAVVRVGARIGL
jgi:hypothetical protein